jgi:DNA-binding CsgD family transcriptional regulator
MTAFVMDPAAVAPRIGISALSDAELDVLRLIVAGKTTRQAADARTVSIHTVRVQMYSIYKKLEVKHRAELVLWALHHGFGGTS